MEHMGLRAMPWGGIRFDRAHVASHNVVPVPYTEFAEGMAWGWLFISVSSIAIAEAALRACVAHARSHVSFGRPLGHMEGVQAQLARLRGEIDAARLLAQRVAWHRAAGRSARDEIAMLKAYATELAVAATQSAVQIHGAWALQPGHPVERLYRDAPMNVIGGFASNRLRELIAEGMGTTPAVYRPFDWLSGTGLDEDLRTPTGAGR
jgi:alkylation response protein AidB-like acyl-CoA dehydrogenase